MPQVEGSGELFVMSEGISFRWKNQAAMPDLSHRTAKMSRAARLSGVSLLTGIDTTIYAVEVSTVRIIVGLVTGTTTLIGGVGRRAVVGVKTASGKSGQLLVIGVRGDSTAHTGMDRDLILSKIVHAFKNIDFTTFRPVRTVLPPGRPSATASRHVIGVHDDHASVPTVEMSTTSSHSRDDYFLHFVAVDSNRLPSA